MQYIIKNLTSQIAKITIQGDLVLPQQQDELLSAVQQHIAEENTPYFIIDLSSVRLLNSTGISALLSILTATRNIGGDAAICNLSARIANVLIITKLTHIFSIYSDVEAALVDIKKQLAAADA